MKADAKFWLTEEQNEIVAPLVYHIDEDSAAGEESAIVAQLLVWANGEVQVRAKWLDGRGAAIMQRALGEIEQLPEIAQEKGGGRDGR